MIIEITLNSQPSEIFTIELDQVVYRVRLSWVDKEDAWYLDLYDRFGQALFLGHKVLYGASILAKYHAIPGVPQGEFLLLDGTAQRLRPTYESISDTDRFFYFDESEVT